MKSPNRNDPTFRDVPEVKIGDYKVRRYGIGPSAVINTSEKITRRFEGDASQDFWYDEPDLCSSDNNKVDDKEKKSYSGVEKEAIRWAERFALGSCRNDKAMDPATCAVVSSFIVGLKRDHNLNPKCWAKAVAEGITR